GEGGDRGHAALSARSVTRGALDGALQRRRRADVQLQLRVGEGIGNVLEFQPGRLGFGLLLRLGGGRSGGGLGRRGGHRRLVGDRPRRRGGGNGPGRRAGGGRAQRIADLVLAVEVAVLVAERLGLDRWFGFDQIFGQLQKSELVLLQILLRGG